MYLHIQFHLKTGEDLEMYEVDQPSKDKLEEICDLRQPVIFDFDCEKIMATSNRTYIANNYNAFEVKIRNVKDNDFKKQAKEVRDYFTDKKLPMAWWCGPSSLIGKDNQILLELGFVNEEMDVCMAADLENISTGFLSENSDLDIREAVSKAQIRDFSY